MVERYLRQGPLAHLRLAARAAGAAEGAGVRLSAEPFLAQLALRGSGDAGFAAAIEVALGFAPPLVPNRAAEVGPLRALWLGPDEWLVVAPESEGAALAKRLHDALRGQHFALVDASEVRAAIALTGPRARDTLAHGTALDLHPRVFGPGQVAQTLLARMPVILHQRDASPRYDLYVAASSAEHLWLWLEDAARDYGVAVADRS